MKKKLSSDEIVALNNQMKYYKELSEQCNNSSDKDNYYRHYLEISSLLYYNKFDIDSNLDINYDFEIFKNAFKSLISKIDNNKDNKDYQYNKDILNQINNFVSMLKI